MKVSVILPVYGVADYIVQCTRSLLDQTLDEVEYLFVDDHGPDNSIELAQQAIAGHPKAANFRFLRPEHNLGAGCARNYALPYATGEYVAFVDSDDTIEPDMLELLYNKAVQTNADLCCCQLQKYDPEGHAGDILSNPRVEDGPLTHDKRAYVLTHYVSLFSSFLYRRNFIEQNHIEFPPDRSADDSYFVSCAWMTAQRIAYVDRPLYRYLIRPGSVTTTQDSDKYRKRLAVFAKLMHYAKESGAYAEFSEEIDYMYLKKGYLSSATNHIINSTRPNRAALDIIRSELLQQVPNYRSNRYYRSQPSMRVMVSMLHYCPRLAIPLLRTYAKRNNIVS
ncbi:MAG: glycosyltransferase [Bacteroidales bacterium]|nr:glycosyltransferase [Bacteroidales bacterium]